MTFWTSFWDIIWWFIWAFVFIAYLFALLAIIGDLFRDHKLSGWWKAVWIIALVFIPFITALVYLIVRGNGMAERQATKPARDNYVQPAAAQSPSDEIAKAKRLLDEGVISGAEYAQIKLKAMK